MHRNRIEGGLSIDTRKNSSLMVNRQESHFIDEWDKAARTRRLGSNSWKYKSVNTSNSSWRIPRNLRLYDWNCCFLWPELPSRTVISQSQRLSAQGRCDQVGLEFYFDKQSQKILRDLKQILKVVKNPSPKYRKEWQNDRQK